MKEYRVYLRKFELDDYKVSTQWRNDDEVQDLMGGMKHFVSEAIEKKWIEDTLFNSNELRLAICLKNSKEYIGNIYATNINMVNRSCNIQIFIGAKQHWHKGYAKEAYMLLMEYLFNEMNMHRIFAHVLEENEASLKLHQAVGFQQEGLLRETIYKHGRYHNQIILSCLKSDYENFIEKSNL